jgi:hypothetical protein
MVLHTEEKMKEKENLKYTESPSPPLFFELAAVGV